MKASLLLLIVLLGSVSKLHAHEGDIVQVGQPAPTFTGTDSDGKSLSLDSLKGKVVLVDFFATWCPSCIEEIPLVETDVWEKYKSQGLVVIAIGREHTVEEMATFKAQKQLTFTILADPHREIYAKYAKEFIPRSYLIDGNGIVQFAVAGYDADDFARMKAQIESELGKNTKVVN